MATIMYLLLLINEIENKQTFSSTNIGMYVCTS